MRIINRWRKLGWRHPLWDFVRFWSVVQRQKREEAARWVSEFRNKRLEVDSTHHLPVEAKDVKLFFKYLNERDQDFQHANGILRTEDEAIAHCHRLGTTVGKVRTQNVGHHQSSAAVVAAVSFLTQKYCQARGLSCSLKPDRRCVWLVNNQLHVTARNLDGAIPALAAPTVVREIKEYWGKTQGGSKMSDAVYECQLGGRELREFEERSGAKITHVVFLDGKEQWTARQSDLRRFIDLFHQGIIDHLLIGKEVETDWQPLLVSLLGPLS